MSIPVLYIIQDHNSACSKLEHKFSSAIFTHKTFMLEKNLVTFPKQYARNLNSDIFLVYIYYNHHNNPLLAGCNDSNYILHVIAAW